MTHGKLQKKLCENIILKMMLKKAYYLQNKFENVSTIAKDSCFHFHYMGKKERKRL